MRLSDTADRQTPRARFVAETADSVEVHLADVMKDYQVRVELSNGVKEKFVIDALNFFHAMDQFWQHIDQMNTVGRNAYRPLWFTMTEKGIYDRCGFS